MIEPRTHFEQISLEIVRRIVKEQSQRQTATEESQTDTKKASEKDLLGRDKN
jgi:hypothetical protein